MTTPPTPQPQPAPLPERVQESESGALLAQLDAIPSALRRSHHDAQLEHHDAILKQVIELSRRGIAALAAAEAERDALRAAGRELLTLKDGPRDAAYHELKPFAWKRLRAALGGQS